ncbi:glycosyltransferase [Mycobacterium sp. CBMA293]|nr:MULTISPECIES: glycosyltransferase [unclassified Mycolicibacterium]MUL60944.1 glycosyltransferase [Mycolicibacterium sp. CBMA 335]MUL71957.1 glycosyltransferase [Mycolicibacterium sp. CBMA 311]MUM09020.1 glycosyltransferase [Mycolicibacterium sp. CBMA 213]MUM13272.1 glycosyltransferase [Mycolicibacterium sp. CBMA 293]MUL49042.1 glycosyltransferase [Mycolicibacterium sp. CBMA 360]
MPAPKFDHLLRLTDYRGTAEHACGAGPRPESGYRTDDMARVLVVSSREPHAGEAVHGLARLAVRFLNEAQSFSGGCRNRMDCTGHWADEYALADCWGRCIWGLGTAAAHSDIGLVRSLSVVQFERAVHGRSARPRAMAFAALGAAELLSVDPGHFAARKLLNDYAAGVPTPDGAADWPWPEARLSYANAVLPEAMIAAGVTLDDSALCQRGLDLLEWLIDCETVDGHLSVTPAGGWSAGELRPGFVQQPIEVAALADACTRAAAVDASAIWPNAVRVAAAWFQGANDAATPMWDPASGGGFDELHADGVSVDQGAESTLAALSTFQQARRLVAVSQ